MSKTTFNYFSIENDGRIRQFSSLLDIADSYGLQVKKVQEAIDKKTQNVELKTWFRKYKHEKGSKGCKYRVNNKKSAIKWH